VLSWARRIPPGRQSAIDEKPFRVEPDQRSPVANGDRLSSVYNAVFGAQLVDPVTGRSKTYYGLETKVKWILILGIVIFVLVLPQAFHALGAKTEKVGELIGGVLKGFVFP